MKLLKDVLSILREDNINEALSKFDPVEYLKGLHTKQLMNLRKAAHANNGRAVTDYLHRNEVTIDQIKTELAKREHVPNKIETKAARQALAKAKKNR